MASIKIPTPLRPYAGNSAEIEVQGATVGEALASLVGQHPDLRAHLFDGGDLRSFVNVFVGEEDIRFLQDLDTPIQVGSRLRIIPAIAGGRPI